MLLQGCGAGWRRPATLALADLTPRQQVQVWRQGSAVRWHAVVVTADSIQGIPFHLPIECDSCRVAWPRASVDSLRLGDPVGAFWKSVGLVLGGLLVGCIAACPREMQ